MTLYTLCVVIDTGEKVSRFRFYVNDMEDGYPLVVFNPVDARHHTLREAMLLRNKLSHPAGTVYIPAHYTQLVEVPGSGEQA